MDAAASRLEFAPPPTPGMLRALGLAIIAHLLLAAALTWGVHWKSEPTTLTAEAELWSAVPQQAAPRLIESPPPPPPPVVAAPNPVPAPVPPPDVAPPTPDADIALAREKQRKEKEKAEQAAEAKLQAKRAAEKQRLAEKREAERIAELKAEKKAAEDKRKADLKLAEQTARRKETLKAQEDARKLEAQRQENIQRMAGLAGATGSPSATGTALQSSGPSSSYAGRIKARIKPNIVFVETIAGNPMVDVEVRSSPDGTIIGRKIIKSSGVPAWDESILKAIDKTEVLPRDVDGRVPTPLVIGFRPKD